MVYLTKIFTVISMILLSDKGITLILFILDAQSSILEMRPSGPQVNFIAPLLCPKPSCT